MSPGTYVGTLPSSLGNIKTLQSLVLYSNEITGPLPASLSDLKNLQYLDIHTNNIATTPTRRRKMLEDMPIPSSSSSLRGIIIPQQTRRLDEMYLDPSFFVYANMTSLITLDISDNDYTGQVPALLCNLLTTLETLILVSVSPLSKRHENQFTCIAKCLRDSQSLNLILPANLPTCVEMTLTPTLAPTPTPTLPSEVLVKNSPSNTPLSNGVISGVTIGCVFFVCLFCGCVYYSLLIKGRSHLPSKSSTYQRTSPRGLQHREDEDIVRVTSVNVMNLRDITEATTAGGGGGSASSDGSSSTSSTSTDTKQWRAGRPTSRIMKKQSSESGDTVDSYFQTPTHRGDREACSSTLWSEDLADFQKGNVKMASRVPLQSPEFTFGDVYTSSSDGGDDDEDGDDSVYPNESEEDDDDEGDGVSVLHRHLSFQSELDLIQKQESADSAGLGVQDLYPDSFSQISTLSNDDLLSLPSRLSSFEHLSHNLNTNTAPPAVSPIVAGRKSIPRRGSEASSSAHPLTPHQQQLLASLHRNRTASANPHTSNPNASRSPKDRSLHSTTSGLRPVSSSTIPSLFSHLSPPYSVTSGLAHPPPVEGRSGGEHGAGAPFTRRASSDGSVDSAHSQNKQSSERRKMERSPSEQFEL
jgi:hypothetical protein